MNKILGIDPGLNGAWSIYVSPWSVYVYDLPTTGEGTKRRIDDVWFADELRKWDISHANVELVHTMPGQGVASSGRFMQAFGTILGVLGALKIPRELISPQRWKKHYSLIGADAEGSRQKAIDLFPGAAPFLQLKKHHNRSEAMLLAAFPTTIVGTGNA